MPEDMLTALFKLKKTQLGNNSLLWLSWEGQNTKYALLMFFEHVEIDALFGRTKWTQRLR